jgi:hypothetical protein
MIHEILGINNGRVDMSGVPDISPDLKVEATNKRHNDMILSFVK